MFCLIFDIDSLLFKCKPLRDHLPAQAGLMIRNAMWNVYLLKSKNRNWYYVGSTNDLARHIREHESGKVQSTKAYRPLILIFTKDFNEEEDARMYERKLKKSRIEKETIIKKLSEHNK